MTKQNFIALADSIIAHDRVSTARQKFTQEQLEALANFCEDQNGSFNRARWFGYIAGESGPSGGKVKAAPATPTVTITVLEQKVLTALFHSSAGNGHDFGFVEDCRKAVAKADQLGGVIASLSKKGLIHVHEPVVTDGVWTQTTWATDLNVIETLITTSPKGGR